MIKMVILNSVTAVTIFIIQACSAVDNKKSNIQDNIDTVKQSNKVVKIADEQSDTLVSQWREDSIGCKKLRSYEMGNTIVIKYDLKNKSVSEIINLLGEPNKKLEYKKTGIILRYYYYTCCHDGKLDFECDYSWWDFLFNDSSVANCKMGGGKI